MVHVLYVEDDQAFAELTAEFLRRLRDDWSISIAPSADEAIEELNGHIDCIVSDFDMPGLNGLEFLQAVREDHLDLPFILFTGKGSEEVASDAISAGVTDYLQKGGGGRDQYEVLANRIQNAVSRHQAEREVQRGYAALEAASDGIALLDVEGDITYVNQSFADHYGYDKAELEGSRWEMLHERGEVERFYDEIIPVVVETGTWVGRTTGKRKDGSTILEDHTITLSADRTTICVVRDITDKRDREQALAEELAFLDDALDQLDDIFYIFDNDGTLLWWNDQANRVTGYSDDDLASMGLPEFVREADRDEIRTFIETVGETGTAQVEAELLLADGSTIPYGFYSAEFTDPSDERIGHVGVGRDISLQKTYEWELERHNKRLDEFASVLSHDLRNPLSVAKGHVELLAEDVGATDAHRIEELRAALDRIQRIIEDVLELSRTGLTVAERERIELDELAASVWSTIERGQAELTAAEVTIDGDASLLERLLTNLLRNAIEHGGEDTDVRVGPLAEGNGFYVEDDGPGIPTADRDRVFDWKYSTKDGGSGIGLRSVQQVCEAHGWDIAIVESDSGGTRFEISTGTDEAN